MNILIKLTCLIGLVIAPILGGHTVDADNHDTSLRKEVSMKIGKCDPAKMASMTKEECAKMCDEMGCTAEQKESCLAHYDASGKFVAHTDMACCAKAGDKADVASINKEVRIETTNTNGEWVAIVTTTEGAKVDTKVFEGSEAEVKEKLAAYRK